MMARPRNEELVHIALFPILGQGSYRLLNQELAQPLAVGNQFVSDKTKQCDTDNTPSELWF